jgi:hypothetical protein
LIGKLTRERKLEIAFITVFSALVFVIFFTLISMNGVVLGNDPAVHLEKAQIFLQTGKIPLANIGWNPPLYEILLAMLISFSGATDIGQLIFLVKVLAVIIDWLLFFSVYLVASKFFNKKVGAVAVVLLLMCFPMFEANAFGGYTTVLGMAFILLVFLYLTLATEQFGYLVVTFLAAFALVLSHQLATFLAVFMLPPVLIFMLIKSRGASLKVIIALILGGGIAFFLYYFQAMIGYMGIVIEYIFFAIKTYAYQIPAASFNSFINNFGFIFFLALSGFFISHFILKKQKKLIFYIVLIVSFFVPLFFAESYLFGFYMPFQWFIYYLTPAMAIFAAVSLAFIGEQFVAYYAKKGKSLHKNWLKIITVSIVVLMCLLLVFRANEVYGKAMEASVYYSTSDVKAYQAGTWLNSNYPGEATVVVTEAPGFWFRTFSGKNVIAATNPIIERNLIAESVLDFSYEIEQPLTLIRAYEAKGDLTDENYVSINSVWNRVSYSSGQGDFVSYNIGGVTKQVTLSEIPREITLGGNQNSSKTLSTRFVNDEIAITQTILVQNNSYATTVGWELTPLKSEVTNASLYLSSFFDLQFSFKQAYLPNVLNWESPWNKPTSTHGNDWAVTYFSNSTLKDNYIGFYDDSNQIYFAVKFNELPNWGNVGALTSRQIDAVRFQYNYEKIAVNQTASLSYQTLAFSKNSYPTIQQPSEIQNIFTSKPSATFDITTRDYHDYIQANNIQFIVYDKNQLDTKIIHSKMLELIYSNDRYVIFKIRSGK